MERNLVPAEQAVVAYLRALTGEHVGTTVPNPRPASFVVIQRGAGSVRNLAQTEPNMVIQVWGSTGGPHPWDLTKVVWEALAGAAEVEHFPQMEVMRVQITDPASYADEATGSPRYVFNFIPTVNTN